MSDVNNEQPGILNNTQTEFTPTPEVKQLHDDITISFGQGPIKPVLLFEELNPAQQQEWEAFSQNRLHSKEPEFTVIPKVDREHIDSIRAKIESAQKDPALTPEEKQQLKQTYELQIKTYRDKLQHNPRLALHRYGRLVSYSTGAALAEGLTDTIILTGGRTIPGWAKPDGQNPVSADRTETWPSEAELMKQLIIGRFGREYKKRTGKDIEEAIHIEDRSPTSIHNLDYTFDRYKNLLSNAQNINLATTDVHMKRVMAIAQFMLEDPISHTPAGAQTLLRERAKARNKIEYDYLINYTHDPENNPIAQAREVKEDQLYTELTDPRVMATLELSDWKDKKGIWHDVIVRIVKPDSTWMPQAKQIFSKAGINFDNLSPETLENLQQTNPEQYNKLKQTILELNNQFKSQYQKDKEGLVQKKDV